MPNPKTPRIRSLVRTRRPTRERAVSFEHHDDGLNVDTSTPRPASPIIDSAIYLDGQRVATMDTITDTDDKTRLLLYSYVEVGPKDPI